MSGPSLSTSDLRTRRPEPATSPEHRLAEKRRGTCGHPLASDNGGPLCSACQGKAESERFAALPKIATLKLQKKEVLHVGNITMTPKAMPDQRMAVSSEYEEAIREFLESGEAAVLVTVPGRQGKAIYATMRAALGRMKETRCYLGLRMGDCYLVRKGGVK